MRVILIAVGAVEALAAIVVGALLWLGCTDGRQGGRVLTAEGVYAWSRVYPEEGHISLPVQANPDILEWTAARFAGEPVSAGCRGI